ncbi:MAG: hypothetical protein AAGU76_04645 [Sedimentibacter sp.]|uniref:hypothetical protein n=1 Tax=Sedimentibacter sp. TaxID=1960295 RepID=UPI003158CAE9
MKKSVYIAMILIISSFSMVFANSAPVYWQGYPSYDILNIDKDSPIVVKGEDLIFDFSDENNDSHSVEANVTAQYEMINPTDKTISVQMAFPFVERLYDIDYDSIKITADGKELPYEVYIGNVINSYGNSFEENKGQQFDFDEIVTAISNDMYEAKSFSADEIGKLYSIEIKPTTDKGIDFTVDFTYDQDETKILTENFNGFSLSGGKARITSGCFQPQTAEIYVLGEDINMDVKGYTLGSSKEETDMFTYEITEKEVDVRTYLLGSMKNYSFVDYEHLSDIQIYNLYAGALDKYFMNNMGFCTVDDVLSESGSVRVITLLYSVEFLPSQSQTVSVSYNTKGTMDKRNTSSPQYLFDYILNPAKNWNSFNNLNIKIITPQEAPYIIHSSIELNKEEGNVYTASLEKLPEDDLSFALYSKEKITLYDKIEGRINRSFGYFAPIVIGIVGFSIIVISFIIARKFKKR